MASRLHLRLDSGSEVPRRLFDGSQLFDGLRCLWKRRAVVAAVFAAGLALGVTGLAFYGPRYTSEALIRLNFAGEAPAGGTRSQPVASMEASALVDSAARIARARATASAAVERHRLDLDPRFAGRSNAAVLLGWLAALIGIEQATAPHDLATNVLLRHIKVTTEPRSYVITIAATASEPELAARLANMIALEYLRGQLLQQLTDAKTAVERELAETSAVCGFRHPNYALAEAKLQTLQDHLNAVRKAPSEDDVKNITGVSWLRAETVLTPSGPNSLLIFVIGSGVVIGLGCWLALMLERRRIDGELPVQ